MRVLLNRRDPGRWASKVGIVIRRSVQVVSFVVGAIGISSGAHAAQEHPSGGDRVEFRHSSEVGHEIPGLSFRVFVDRGAEVSVDGALDEAEANAALQTVRDTFSYLNQHRQNYPRFDEAVRKGLLDRVIIQPGVRNHEGKSFLFLVVRTMDPGRVRLLISASSIKEKGYLGRPERFAPVLAREFQWVVSKAETGHKTGTVSVQRDLRNALIRVDKDIRSLLSEERVQVLQQLFGTYLRTIDDLRSLMGSRTTKPAVRSSLRQVSRIPRRSCMIFGFEKPCRQS